MARAHLLYEVTDDSGNSLSGADVNVYATGTTNAVSGAMYDAATGGAVITNPLVSDSRGYVEAWLTVDQTVDLVTLAGTVTRTAAGTSHTIAQQPAKTQDVFAIVNYANLSLSNTFTEDSQVIGSGGSTFATPGGSPYYQGVYGIEVHSATVDNADGQAGGINAEAVASVAGSPSANYGATALARAESTATGNDDNVGLSATADSSVAHAGYTGNAIGVIADGTVRDSAKHLQVEGLEAYANVYDSATVSQAQGVSGTVSFSGTASTTGDAVSLLAAAITGTGGTVGGNLVGVEIQDQSSGGPTVSGRRFNLESLGANSLNLFAGSIIVAKNSAPANGDLVAGECAFWYDDTNGAPVVNWKGKTADGTVVSGSMSAETAGAISYDNGASGLTATDVQAAIDEMVAAGGTATWNVDLGAMDASAFTESGGAVGNCFYQTVISGSDLWLILANSGGAGTLTLNNIWFPSDGSYRMHVHGAGNGNDNLTFDVTLDSTSIETGISGATTGWAHTCDLGAVTKGQHSVKFSAASFAWKAFIGLTFERYA